MLEGLETLVSLGVLPIKGAIMSPVQTGRHFVVLVVVVWFQLARDAILSC